jgi:hypothetical protein
MHKVDVVAEAGSTHVPPRSGRDRDVDVVTFLQTGLTGGAVDVSELEILARAARPYRYPPTPVVVITQFMGLVRCCSDEATGYQFERDRSHALVVGRARAPYRDRQ